MANWCSGQVEVSGRPEDIENFCKHFLFYNEGDDKEENEYKALQDKYFARSFMHCRWEDFKEMYEIGKVDCVSFGVEFAWSGHSCLVGGYPQNNPTELITLSEACKLHNVKVEIETEEIGCCFEEKITCDKQGNINEKCFDMPTYKCKNCGSTQHFPSSYSLKELNEEEECWECEKETEWELVKEAVKEE